MTNPDLFYMAAHEFAREATRYNKKLEEAAELELGPDVSDDLTRVIFERFYASAPFQEYVAVQIAEVKTQLLRDLDEGLRQSAEGDIVDLGSFAQYLDGDGEPRKTLA